MGDLRYELDWSKGELRSKILEGINREYPDLDINEISDYADEAIKKIIAQGNSALTYGLTLQGRDIVREMIEEKQEGKLEKDLKK